MGDIWKETNPDAQYEEVELLVDHLEELGYQIGWSDLSEPVIEFLMDEIGIESNYYVAQRYKMDSLIAKSMLRDMIKFRDAQGWGMLSYTPSH